MAKQKSSTNKLQSTSKKIEKQFDQAMHDTHIIIDQKLSPQAKKTLTNVWKTAEAFADTIESVWEWVESITNNIFPSQDWSMVSMQVEYSRKVSRLFIFRVFWLLLQIPIILLWKTRICLITLIHRLGMFFDGRRKKNLWKKQVRFINHCVARKMYVMGLIDARPDIIFHES